MYKSYRLNFLLVCVTFPFLGLLPICNHLAPREEKQIHEMRENKKNKKKNIVFPREKALRYLAANECREPLLPPRVSSRCLSFFWSILRVVCVTGPTGYPYSINLVRSSASLSVSTDILVPPRRSQSRANNKFQDQKTQLGLETQESYFVSLQHGTTRFHSERRSVTSPFILIDDQSPAPSDKMKISRRLVFRIAHVDG